MKNLYLYPIPRHDKPEINPYVNLLGEALGGYFTIVNAGRPSHIGIIDLLRYIRKTDILFLNWIEELPDQFMGILQSFLFLIFLQLAPLFRIKIVWTLHNKQSHFKKHAFLKNMLFRQMSGKSDLIVTHAREGLDFISDQIPSAFIHHPVRTIRAGDPIKGQPGFDIIIWGNIAPYKGVDGFIGFLNEKGILDHYRILIAGKISSQELSERIRSFVSGSENLILKDEFLPESELMSCINHSKLVLFTYHSDSVLSSGALMDSLSQEAAIIGPHTGAFRDLARLGLLETFVDFEDLVGKIDLHLRSEAGMREQKERIARFNSDHSWANYAKQLDRLISRNLS